MRSSDGIIKIISVLVFTALVLYMGFAFFGRVLDPLETILASNVTLEDALELDGYIIRDEVVLSGSDDYVISVESGSKVSAGQAIAVKYGSDSALERASRIRELKAEIKQLESRGSRKSSSQLADDSVLALSEAVNSGNMSEIEMAVTGIETYIFNSESTEDSTELLHNLKTELLKLEDESSSDTSYINTPSSGIFTQVIDGYEAVSYDDLTHIPPSQLHTLFEGKSIGPDAIGKVVTGLNWHFALVMDESNAERLESGLYYNIDFSESIGRTISMKTEYVGPASEGKSIVIFVSDKFISDTASLRTLSGNITFSSFTGISVPKKALYRDEDGDAYVYVLVGLQARRADVTVKEELDDGYVVEVEEGSLLRTGSEIITKAKALFDGKVVK